MKRKETKRKETERKEMKRKEAENEIRRSHQLLYDVSVMWEKFLMGVYEGKFSKYDTEFFKERISDYRDLQFRFLNQDKLKQKIGDIVIDWLIRFAEKQ